VLLLPKDERHQIVDCDAQQTVHPLIFTVRHPNESSVARLICAISPNRRRCPDTGQKLTLTIKTELLQVEGWATRPN
jgi:hypothetical protein